MVLLETWLDPSFPQGLLQLEGRSVIRADRTAESGKSRGGGICVYINNNWSSDIKQMDTHCSPDLEYLVVKCRPFYLLREFNVVIITAVYIPPDANTTTAMGHLLTAISRQQRAHPDGAFVVAGDFNRADLRTVLPKFHQYVDCPTRGGNTLDRVYSSIMHGYKTKPLPNLGQSDHISLLMIPSYRPLVRRIRPSTREIRVWPVGASEQLQDCFRSTEWSLFVENNVDTYASTVLFYVKSCIDVVTTTKQIRVFPNNKPWLNRDVYLLLKARNAAFHSGDAQQYREARAKLKKGIRNAKAMYCRRIEKHFESSDPRRVWQGLRQITGQNIKNELASSSAHLADQLNQFFSRFEEGTGTTVTTALATSTSSETTTDRQPFLLQTCDVQRAFRSINIRKAAGPDGIMGRVIRDCAAELAGVFTDIFNLSLLQGSVPTCLKTSIIVPVPKQSVVVSLNDYRPVALTSVVMKCFERLVLDHIKAGLPSTLDPFQFAYRRNRSTDDAISIAVHTVLSHLERQGTYARLLFVDYSSAFNTILPDRLFLRMTNLGIHQKICLWVRNFLTDRPQTVRMGPYYSSTLVLSTGAPQGCVLSPFLYSLYTFDCTPLYKSNTIIKFADDTTVVGLISENDETAYRKEVQGLIQWCKENNLMLNTKKTKELIIDFRRKKSAFLPLHINGEEVERVGSFKYLGIYISEDLSWTANINMVVRKVQGRLYFLRMLRGLNLSQHLLLSYYHSTIESVLTYSILSWYGSSSETDKKALQRIIKIAQNVIGLQLPTLDEIFTSRTLKKSHNILRDPTHPAHNFFELLPSGRRYRTMKTRTTRLLNSFYPRALIALNNDLRASCKK
uniref:Reverse transcriptase domain-containing protein n=1 Tax=Podarcis muralis TaxID=64176 RepID=A0A670JPL4_PODMU